VRRVDRVILQSGRAWFEKAGGEDADALAVNGYGRAAESGGQALLLALVSDVRRKLAPLDGRSLLEVGCGAGAMTSGLATGTRRTIAIDFSHQMLVHAKRVAGGELAVGDAGRLPFAAATFDRVLCYSVFNNFPSLAYAASVVGELVRVTVPGGIVLIGQVPNAARKKDWQRAYAARYGMRAQSNLRWWLGSVKHRALHVIRAAAALTGAEPPAALHFQYYTAGFFQRVAARHALACDALPAYNLLHSGSGDPLADYRLDIRLTVPQIV
jgi:ubiquinone/menaquinone biosynthesis C-methylase UbiE